MPSKDPKVRRRADLKYYLKTRKQQNTRTRKWYYANRLERKLHQKTGCGIEQARRWLSEPGEHPLPPLDTDDQSLD